MAMAGMGNCKSQTAARRVVQAYIREKPTNTSTVEERLSIWSGWLGAGGNGWRKNVCCKGIYFSFYPICMPS